MAAALRCHLLIGPPASGKTTIATLLAPLLDAELLSTDRIRDELYGDPMIQGHWHEVEDRLHAEIQASVAAGRSVLIDATHAQRPWRLALTQRLELDRPVEWIGWWMRTPLEVCLEWNKRRERQVPELVVQQFAAALNDRDFQPSRSEGFAVLVDYNPAADGDPAKELAAEISRLNKRISAARNREQAKELHCYSRLLDLERLLHLLQLLSRYPGLSAGDVTTRAELEAICNPLPEGAMAQRAAAYLSRLRGECYCDVDALEADLLWLQSQGFLDAAPTQQPIEPPPAPENLGGLNLGGWPPMADRSVFIRVFSLLRYLLHHPFNCEKGVRLQEHLISQLGGVYMPGEAGTLRKDVERILTPYGFRTRNDNVRHGYGLGTAVLSAARLREVHQVVSQAVSRLGDPTAQDLLAELDERLRWGGVLREHEPPVRVFANRSIVHPDLVRRDSLAVPAQAEKLEAAISLRQRVLLERFSDAATFGEESREPIHVWPIQLLFHNIGWYLAFEDDAVGYERGLIRTERLDRLALRQVESGFQRTPEQRVAGVLRLTRLMELSGGIYLGKDAASQEQLSTAQPDELAKLLITVRFRCTSRAYNFLREGLQRYPLNQIRMSKPLTSDQWCHRSKAPLVLTPFPDDSHPYPMELDLPPWTVARDVDFRRWILGWGSEIIVETPTGFAQEIRLQVQ
ncbi:AAA family ATPase [Synechococcus sp. A15-28]|uniref:AAA family ATPase n=1 Tax=Synechococcus sp. A15-28 TaxID=1050638 RepID=UPI0016476E56|nr:AAA family ATPase [Synechococcus sp. A15-28]